MALKVLQSQLSPLGQFDALDTELASFKGGEVVTLTGVTYQGTDKAAKDVDDGYAGTPTKYRPAVTKTLSASASGPHWLADDGTTYYGTLFGSVVGGTAGQAADSALGPHTALGSGKITCWNQPGLYGVTLDAVDDSTVAPTVDIAVGAALYATTAGLLTTTSSGAANAGAMMARFVEFATNGSLVTTPNSLVAALNSPSSDVSSAQAKKFTMAVVHFTGS